MTRAELLARMRVAEHAVEASLANGGPQAAVVGIVVTDAFEVFFDTLETTRKAQNLRRDARIAFVIGGGAPGDVQTVQLEGVADEPHGEELARLKQLYFARFAAGPDREQWPGITYFRVRPSWIRSSDFSQDPPVIVEFTAEELSGLK